MADDNNQKIFSSIIKFSIPTIFSILVMGISMFISGNLLDSKVFGPIELFIGYSSLFTNFFILGLDQSLIRFFNEPPRPLTSNSLFRMCVYISSTVFILLCILICLCFYSTLYDFIGFGQVIVNGNSVPKSIIFLMLLNSFSMMILRYFSIVFRMEMNVKSYSIIVVLQQIIVRLLIFIGLFYTNPIMGMSAISVVSLAFLSLAVIICRFGLIKPCKDKITVTSLSKISKYGITLAPTILFITLNTQLPKSLILHELGPEYQAIYSFLLTLANIVTLVQAGFSTFWGAYVFKYYHSEQKVISKVHDYLNLIVLTFYALLVLFQDVIFLFFSTYNNTVSKTIFPLIMLASVFNILCEGTVYGNSIAQKPIFDTVGIAVSFIVNIFTRMLLIPMFTKDTGLLGCAIALSVSSFLMFTMRTLSAQKYYRTIKNYKRTSFVITITICYTIIITVFIGLLWVRVSVSCFYIIILLVVYQNEIKKAIASGIDAYRRRTPPTP